MLANAGFTLPDSSARTNGADQTHGEQNVAAENNTVETNTGPPNVEAEYEKFLSEIQ